MFDHTVVPSASAPSRSLTSVNKGLAPDSVLIKGGIVDIVDGMVLSAGSNLVKKAVVQVMTVGAGSGACNVETEIIRAETDRLYDNTVVSSKFADSGIEDRKFQGTFPVSLGGTGVSNLSPGLLVGSNGIIGTSQDLIFDFNTSILSTSSIVRFLVDPTDVNGGHFDLALVSGVPKVTSSAGFPSVDDLSGRAGIAPAVHAISVSNATDSNAILTYEVRDQDNDQRLLYVAWYNKSSDYPLDAEEIMVGANSIGFNAVDISGPGSASSNIILGNLGPISSYVVRCVADDTRGNVSIPKSLDFRTTEFGAPEIVEVAALSVGTEGIKFTASNKPDTSAIIAYAGAFLSLNARTAEDLFVDLRRDGLDGIFVSNIPANTASNLEVVVQKYRDSTNLLVPAAQVTENRTYYPFYLIVDSQSNASLCNLRPIYYGNAPTWNNFPGQTNKFFDSKIEVAWQAADPDSGIRTVLSHVGTQAVTYEYLLANGESNAASVNPKQIPVGTNLDHTTEYVVTVAAVDNSGLCNIESFSAKTLDNVPPIISNFQIASSGSNARVEWTAEDKSGIANVYIAEKSESWTPSVEDVRVGNTVSSTSASSNVVLTGTPSWCNTYVFAVAEDKATDFGATTNLLSTISEGVIQVPNIPTVPQNWFLQSASAYEISASNFSFVTNDDPSASTATVYFTLLEESDVTPVLTPQAHSNFVVAYPGNVTSRNLP